VRYLLDTCVLSEMVKPRPSKKVLRWVTAEDEQSMFLSVLTIGELHKGISKLPEDSRREKLGAWVNHDLASRFRGRVLDVDATVAAAWGTMVGRAELRGEPLPVIDSLICATAEVHGCAVVTRNVLDFERAGADVVCPW